MDFNSDSPNERTDLVLQKLSPIFYQNNFVIYLNTRNTKFVQKKTGKIKFPYENFFFK